jgi:hypothetical protein
LRQFWQLYQSKQASQAHYATLEYKHEIHELKKQLELKAHAAQDEDDEKFARLVTNI